MKINRVDPIYPTQLNTIPKEHWKWCGHMPINKDPEILNGDLILYNKYGKIVIHSSENKEKQNG